MARGLGMIALVLVLAACDIPILLPRSSSAPRLCTAVGCESGVSFHVGEDLQVNVAYDVETCVGDLCERQVLRVPLPTDGPFTGTTQGSISLQIDTDTVRFNVGDQEMPGSHHVRITIWRDGEPIVEEDADVEFVPTQPNGPGCEPVCWGAEVFL